MKTYIRFGLIFALVQTLFIAAEFLLGYHTEKIADLGGGQLVFMIIAISIMTWGLMYRKSELGGQLAYLDGVKMGWVVGLISGTIGVAVFQFYLLYVNPGFLELAADTMVEIGHLSVEDAAAQYAYPNYLVGMFIFSQVAGALTNVVVGLFLKTSWK